MSNRELGSIKAKARSYTRLRCQEMTRTMVSTCRLTFHNSKSPFLEEEGGMEKTRIDLDQDSPDVFSVARIGDPVVN